MRESASQELDLDDCEAAASSRFEDCDPDAWPSTHDTQAANKNAAPAHETGRKSDSSLSTVLSDPRVLRGTGVSGLLERRGHHFRDNRALAAATFAEEDAVRWWSKSWQAEQIDDFLSHCWADSGRSKAFAVHLYYNGEAAALTSIVIGSVFAAFRSAGWLPTFVLEDYFSQGVHMYYAPWSLITGSFVFFLMLAFGHHVTDSLPVRYIRGRRAIFFDKLCVHQRDPELKEQGVNSFAAIVGKSRRMVLLWSPTYFTRLWCTLECATLVRISQRDEGKKVQLPLVFYPIIIANNTVILACVVLFCSALYSCGKVPGLQLFPWMNPAIMFGILSVMSPVYMHSLRRYMRQRRLLSKQLEEFSIGNAGCVVESDRDTIYKTLGDWFGTPDAFNHVVQTTVREHVIRAIGSELGTSLRVIAFGFVPIACHNLDMIPVYISLGGWKALMLILHLASYTLWAIALAQQFHCVAWLTAQLREPNVADLAVTASAALAMMCLAVVQLAPLEIIYRLPMMSTIWFVAITVCFLLFAILVTGLHAASRR